MSSGSNNSNSQSDLEDNMDDTIVQQVAQTDTTVLINGLMERMKVLEANHEKTTMQLIESERKRAQLQERLQTAAAVTTTNKQVNIPISQPTHEGEYPNILSQSTNAPATPCISPEHTNNVTSSTAVHMLEPVVCASVCATSQHAQYTIAPVSHKGSSLCFMSNNSSAAVCPPYNGAVGSQPSNGNIIPPTSVYLSTSVCPPYIGASGSQPSQVISMSPTYVSLSTSVCPPYIGASGSQPSQVNSMSPTYVSLSTPVFPPYHSAVYPQNNNNGQSSNATPNAQAPISLSTSMSSSFSRTNVSQPNYAATGNLTTMPLSTSMYPAYNSAYCGSTTPVHYSAARKLHELPEFSGQPEQWPIFITTFNESTMAYGYTLLENIFRLQKSLKGPAKDEVESLLINPQNVMRIIEQLALKYGQPELLIKSQLQKAYEIDAIDEGHLERLVPFATKVQNLTLFLQNANASQHLNNPMLLEKLVSKMPMTKKIEWATYSSQIHPYVTLEHFCIWIAQIAKIISKASMSTVPMDNATASKGQTVYNKSRPRQENKSVMHTADISQSNHQPACHKCNGNHYITQCKEFSEKSIEEKWKIVKQLRLCFCCLRKGHNVYGCKRKVACKEKGCKRLHHPLLHKNEQQPAPDTKVVNTIQNKTTSCLFKVVPVELVGPNKVVIKSYAFLDEGSSATLINESLAKELGVHVKKENLTLQWFGNRVTNVTTMKCNLRICGVGENKKWYKLSANSVPKFELPLQTVNLKELHHKFTQLEGLPIQEYCDATPSILIGINNCHLTRSLQSVMCNKGLVASKTPLGWVIYGISKEQNVTSCRVSIILHTRVKENNTSTEEIHKMVEEFFTTESFGVAKPDKPLESAEISRARDILRRTSRRVGNRFETGLLWKSDDVKLPNSFSMALSRLRSVEMKMKQDPEYSQLYRNAILNFLEKGYAVKMTAEEATKIGPRTWHLPHFAVFNINKPKKLRLVFDAAAAVNGLSLNSVLLKGPDENPPLTKVLFQFREDAIGVCADIKEMFLQVRIREEDQDSLRFLWKSDDSSKNVETYKMVSMIFGASCSPCCAQFIKNLNAEEVASDQLEVMKAVKNSHYVDDYVCSFKTIEEALNISQAVKRVHLEACFELRGFISNSPLVQRQLNGELNENLTLSTVQIRTDSVDKILGIHWDSRADKFYFKLQLNRVDPDVILGRKSPSKRELLSLVMSVYDPFGMLAEYIIYGKLLIQEVWRAGIQWNEAVPENVYMKFKQWIGQLDNVKKFCLPRCYSPYVLNESSEVEIHIFVDASESAFAAVGYWRIINALNIEVSFIAGKTKCAPLKMLSIPRLELQAAVLGNRLRNSIIASHNVNASRTIYWSDSRTVLCWIKSDERLFKPFVAHRVSEILETSTPKEWRWVPSNLNVADMGTRAKYPINYETPNKWILGPDFLRQSKDHWPKQTSQKEHAESLAERKKICLAVVNEPIVNLSRFSNYLRLQRTFAWVLRFVNRLQGINCASLERNELTANELLKAELVLCRMAQRQNYKQELIDLVNNQNVSKSSEIYTLNPMLNKNGLLVVNGRLSYAIALPESARHPIILPRRHDLTNLIVMWYHQRFHHQNEEIVVNEIRRKFWIPHLRREVKRVITNCQECKNNVVKPKPPLMGQLPVDRVKPYVRPFSYTGIDYFGPVIVTIGRRHEKRWVALFTCLTIRAVHVELAADLSTDSCILCIRNFVNRRGVPVKIRSDMGTNFVGTDGEFKRVKDLFDYDGLQAELATRGIEWDFNCPANPSSGGCWERLIRTVKRVLAATLKSHAPQVETLRSLLIEAENIVNSRPLTHLPVNVDDPEPLTPNHFLLGTTNSTQTPGEEHYVCTRKQYRVSQQLKNMFWHRWIREYLPTLTRRTKWFEPLKPIEKGDVVLICDENQPRNQWKRGVVTRPIIAKDGQSRIAELRTSNGILRRPVSKLAILDIIGKPAE